MTTFFTVFGIVTFSILTVYTVLYGILNLVAWFTIRKQYKELEKRNKQRMANFEKAIMEMKGRRKQ